MNKQISFMILFLFMFTLVSAESIGTFKINQEMQISNYCDVGTCTYVTLMSLEYPNGTLIYPNTNMTKNGQAYNYTFTPDQIGTHTFVTCGDSTLDVCDKDTFFVNFNGEENSIATMIILLLFFIGLFLFYGRLSAKIDFEKWYNKIVNQYGDKNFMKVAVSAVMFTFMKSKIVIYYMIGFPIMLILVDIVSSYQIDSLLNLLQTLMFVYSLGIIIIAFMFFGELQEFLFKAKEDVINQSWGIDDK